MGKERRKRTKYHFSNETKNLDDVKVDRFEESVSGLKIDVTENIFKDVDIKIDDVIKNVMEVDDVVDDSKSTKTVKSISRSIKSFKRSLGDIHLKKNDKRTLRRNIFLKKLQQSYVNSNKNKKKPKIASLCIQEIDEHLPTVDMIFHQPKQNSEKHPENSIKKPKVRGIMKAKDRKKALMNNIAEFRKIFEDTKFKSNPLDVVTEALEVKVFEENQ